MTLLADQTLSELVAEQEGAMSDLIRAQAKQKASQTEISRARCRLVEVEAKLRELKWASLVASH